MLLIKRSNFRKLSLCVRVACRDTAFVQNFPKKVLIVSEVQWESSIQRGYNVRHFVFRNDVKGTESDYILRFVRLIAHLIN